MKEEGSGKELEALLREALNSGLESPRGGQPIHQLKTVPLTVQTLPKGARSLEEPARDSVPGLAKKIAPNSVPPKPSTVKASAAAQAKGKTGANKAKKDSDTNLAKAIEAAPAVEPRRSSMSVLVGMGLVALAAAGGAVWFAKKHQIGPMATAPAVTAPVTAAPTASASVEGAVGIAVTRPADAPPTATPVAVTPPPPATEPAPPPTSVVASAPAPKDEPRPQPTLTLGGTPPPAAAKAAEPKAAAEPAPKPAKAHHAAAPAPKSEPKPEKTAAAEPPPPKPAAPAPAAGGVDALLQQQLKGAIP